MAAVADMGVVVDPAVAQRSSAEEDGVNYNWSFFHLTFMMAAFYLMMVITDWANIRDGHTANSKVGNGLASVWIQLASSWVVGLLYIWTLIAPICLPNRDFS